MCSKGAWLQAQASPPHPLVLSTFKLDLTYSYKTNNLTRGSASQVYKVNLSQHKTKPKEGEETFLLDMFILPKHVSSSLVEVWSSSFTIKKT